MAATTLAAMVGVVVPRAWGTPLTGTAYCLCGAHTTTSVWVTNVARLIARLALLASPGGDAPESGQTSVTLGSTHSRLTLALTSHIITVIVLSPHRVTDTSLAALAGCDTPCAKRTFVTTATFDSWPAGTDSRWALALFRN